MSGLIRESEIDNELLIQEIEKRPAIYDKKMKEYSYPKLKRRLWNEIITKLFPTRNLNKEQSFRGVLTLQRRWRNLRSSFTRELRHQRAIKAGKDVPRRKRYMYFKKLLFLLPSIEYVKEQDRKYNMPLYENIEILEEDIDEEGENINNDEEQVGENINDTEIPMYEQIEILEEDDTNNFDSVDYSTQTVHQRRPQKNKKRKWYGESLLDMFKEKTDTQMDADINFALSLVPMLKLIPLNKKIDAQIAILKSLKYYTSPSKYNCTNKQRMRSQDSQALQSNLLEPESDASE